ncbi:MAG TPA: hypothetical protein VFW92_02140 [Candidatus Limnocylindrales bacterium]|nr:hypothetical protein [Candidatus Limnocylindrales bacterium]
MTGSAGPVLRERITPERLAFLGSAVVLAAFLATGPHFGAASPAAPPATLGPRPTPTLSAASTAQLAAQAIAAHEQIAELAASLKTEIAAKRVDATAVDTLLGRVTLSAQSASAVADELATTSVGRPWALRLSPAYEAIATAVQIALAGPAGDPVTLASDTQDVIDACSALPPLTAELRTLEAQLRPPGPSTSPSPSE